MRTNAALKRRGVHGIRELALTFRIADSDHSGALSQEEFVTVFKKLQIPLNEDVCFVLSW